MALDVLALDVGAVAPDFSLRDQNNEIVTLSSLCQSKAVFVIFYPLAFTGTCTGELTVVRNDPGRFASDVLQAVTISVDSPYSHKVFAEREGFDFPLLSDFWPHGAVARSYGVFNDKTGFANRGTFLVGPDGIVRFAEMNGPGQARDPQVWADVIDEYVGAL